MLLNVQAPDFSLQLTLECGQAFRWRKHPAGTAPSGEPTPTWYDGVIFGCAVRVRQEGGALIAQTLDPALTVVHLRHYFALDLDLARVLESISVDAQIREAVTRFRGLRVLRQDPWECLASFICSSYNNIKRIEGMIERVSHTYGAPVSFNGFRGCTFPSADVLAKAPERQLRELGLGFRAPYLKATARMVADGRLPLEQLKTASYDVATSSLMRCDGVGEKVAACVALFGLSHYEAFPVDVWMERAMRYYFQRRRMTPAKVQSFAREHFGAYAGYAQQYLYHYVRTGRSADSTQPTAHRTATS